VDDRVIDGAVDGVGSEVGRASRLAPRIQQGLVRSYALAFLLGAVALLLFLAVRL
jgi:NADH-quinone oxidoreductase subunit L